MPRLLVISVWFRSASPRSRPGEAHKARIGRVASIGDDEGVKHNAEHGLEFAPATPVEGIVGVVAGSWVQDNVTVGTRGVDSICFMMASQIAIKNI
jgi:hypothetical protein